ncbi:unnamed protein product [Cercopithifilaria johnstoni]|uniref:Uncharacterized protein n=1 Tax=Cercopithifilaria johnstoni TaxID=2874296 RepID=A0A8J2PVR6_9BILA|nr:unnamed protein product [Cercopithifilaria johnstoni]
MGSGSVYFFLLILIIIDLFDVFYTQQLTPIIGGKCDINSPEVPIGGKETQFFLKCEQSLQSESDKGVWVVKSRILSTTPQTSSPAAVATVLSSIDNKQQSQQSPKSHNIICVEDKNVKDGDPCSVSSICLQQEQGQMSSNYLQCDQT